MSKPNMTRAEVENASGPELVAFYNAHADKPTKRFANLATGRRRVLELMDEKGLGRKVETITRVGPADEPATDEVRSKAISESWDDNEVRAKRRQRSAVEVDGERYRSVKAAFQALDLPLSKHIAFRIRLKEKGRIKDAFGHSWKIIPLNY